MKHVLNKSDDEIIMEQLSFQQGFQGYQKYMNLNTLMKLVKKNNATNNNNKKEMRDKGVISDE